MFAFRLRAPTEMYSSLLVIGLTLASLLGRSSQHGLLLSPPQRGSLWRYGYDTPPNYDDNGLFCGGIEEYIKTGGKCGVCGDAYKGPREHEAGGKYAKGIIVEQLPAGSTEMKTTIQITSYHMGYFEFRICPHNDIRRPVSQQCLDEHLMIIKEGTPESEYTRYYPDNPIETGKDKYHLTLLLPRGIRCEQCVLQWTYNTGNSWGTDKNGTSCLGCGLQEVFKNCADISIGGTQTVESAQMALIKTKTKTTKKTSKTETKSGLFHHIKKAIENSVAAKINQNHVQKTTKKAMPSPTPVFSTKTPSATTTFSAKSVLENRNPFMPGTGPSFLSQFQSKLGKQFSWLKQIPFHHGSLLSPKTPNPRFTLASKIKFLPDTTAQEQPTTALAFNPSPKIGLHSFYTTKKGPVPRIYEVKYNLLPKSSFNLYTNPSMSLFESTGNVQKVSLSEVAPTVAYIEPKTTQGPSLKTTKSANPTTTNPMDVSQWGKEDVSKLPKKYQRYYQKYKEAKSMLDLFKRKPQEVLKMSKYRKYQKRRNGHRRLLKNLNRDVEKYTTRLKRVGKRLFSTS
ncbi:uncharacterized protein LOC134249165 [Saccostrea cucullata]|uniref:uncharacterized protein LOC134249165 n=1 Tax=Saccostrea cuccullata TaxID=36930 RepID=UPI002ED1310C